LWLKKLDSRVIVTFLEEKITNNDNKLKKLVAELYANDNIRGFSFSSKN